MADDTDIRSAHQRSLIEEEHRLRAAASPAGEITADEEHARLRVGRGRARPAAGTCCASAAPSASSAPTLTPPRCGRSRPSRATWAELPVPDVAAPGPRTAVASARAGGRPRRRCRGRRCSWPGRPAVRPRLSTTVSDGGDAVQRQLHPGQPLGVARDARTAATPSGVSRARRSGPRASSSVGRAADVVLGGGRASSSSSGGAARDEHQLRASTASSTPLVARRPSPRPASVLVGPSSSCDQRAAVPRRAACRRRTGGAHAGAEHAGGSSR